MWTPQGCRGRRRVPAEHAASPLACVPAEIAARSAWRHKFSSTRCSTTGPGSLGSGRPYAPVVETPRVAGWVGPTSPRWCRPGRSAVPATPRQSGRARLDRRRKTSMCSTTRRCVTPTGGWQPSGVLTELCVHGARAFHGFDAVAPRARVARNFICAHSAPGYAGTVGGPVTKPWSVRRTSSPGHRTVVIRRDCCAIVG